MTDKEMPIVNLINDNLNYVWREKVKQRDADIIKANSAIAGIYLDEVEWLEKITPTDLIALGVIQSHIAWCKSGGDVMPLKACPSCICQNCDTGHPDLNLDIVKCPLTQKPECPGESHYVCPGYPKEQGCPAMEKGRS